MFECRGLVALWMRVIVLTLLCGLVTAVFLLLAMSFIKVPSIIRGTRGIYPGNICDVRGIQGHGMRVQR